MRIAYLAVLSAGQRGVVRKVESQIGAWSAAGCEARLFTLAKQPFTPDLTTLYPQIDQEPLDSMLAYLTRYRRLVRRLAQWKPDVVYFRFTPYLPHTEWVARRFPTVAEMNCDDVQQMRLLSSRAMVWRHRLTRGRVLRQVRGIVCVSPDVAERNRERGCPVEVIGNSVKLDDYPELSAPSNFQPRLAFLSADASPWHGMDKMIALARLCPDWTFDMIGRLGLDSPEAARDLPANVNVHGMLDRPAYERVLAQADVALGALALHRYGLDRNSTLKVLEYLAYGLPTIIGYEETHFPMAPWYLMTLPNTPDNVQAELPGIRQFVEAMRGQRVPRETITHLDISAIETCRLQFFERVLAEASATHRS